MNEDKEKSVIDAALNLFGDSLSAAFMLAVPNTTPQVFVVAGTKDDIFMLTNDAKVDAVQARNDALEEIVSACASLRKSDPDHAMESHFVIQNRDRHNATVEMCLSAIRALKSSPVAAMPPEWLPIDSAPKDGKSIFVIIPDSDIPKVAYYNSISNKWIHQWDSWQFDGIDCPTHWMHIPIWKKDQP